MSTIVSRLDVVQIFGDVDDFCRSCQVRQLLSITGERLSQLRMHIREVMTIVNS
ncbi:hypothetical protein IQ238_24280 [Pleurocapsales cyanobacterium LEGE 06147]|nr:hypothetical protein [Pleurocapsales cyanobacterium LEGE 06147]